MLKSILLIEDDEHKRRSILDFLGDAFPDCEVDACSSLMSGVRKVRTLQPDAILLDMTLPNFDVKDGETGGGMHAFGGVEFLKQMRRHKYTYPTIVVTQFETFGQPPDLKDLPELNAELTDEFSPVYRGAIYYHASIDDWALALKSMLEEIESE